MLSSTFAGDIKVYREMNRRYFVTFRRYFVTLEHGNGGATETHAFGRFHNRDVAELCARERYYAPEYEILEVRPETDFEAAMYKVYRFFVRSFRITCAGVIAFFAYLWLSDSGPALGDIPLGELTLNMIFSAFFRVVFILGAVWLCWTVAFGEGPQDAR